MTTPTAEAPKVENTPPSDYDAMASVFADLTAPDPTKTPIEGSTTEVDEAAEAVKAAATETPEAKATREAAEAAAAAATKTPEEIEAEAAAATAAAAETPEAKATREAAEAAATKPATEEVDWEARFKELEASRKEAPAAPAAPEKKEAPAEIYQPEEKAFLAKYAEDWPDVVKGEALRRRGEYSNLVNHIFNEFNRVYAPLIERGAAAADAVADSTSLMFISRVHTDYDDAMYNDVVKWADSLTGMQKRTAKAIIDDGEPQDVVDLISEFKTATGKGVKPKVTAGATAAVAAVPVVPAKVTDLSAAAKKAAKALGVVDSKRSATTTSAVDPDDFDAAWSEAVGGNAK